MSDAPEKREVVEGDKVEGDKVTQVIPEPQPEADPAPDEDGADD